MAEIGIFAKEKRTAWIDIYQEIKAYYKKNSILPLGKNTFTTSTGIDANTWLIFNKSRYKHGKLSAEKEKLLEEIGIDK